MAAPVKPGVLRRLTSEEVAALLAEGGITPRPDDHVLGFVYDSAAAADTYRDANLERGWGVYRPAEWRGMHVSLVLVGPAPPLADASP